MAKKLQIVGFLLLALVFTAIGQTQDSYEYNSEFTWGINKNSSGGLIGGFVFKKAKRINERIFKTYGLEIMNVKNPQEVRVQSPITGNSYIGGKSNYLYAFRFQYGRDVILFTKAPQQGVEIKAVLAVGPSVGIVAPYYIERLVDGQSFNNTKSEQYDPNNQNHASSRILGTGYLFQGLGDSKIHLGGNLKAGINFELGVVKSQVTGFEVGVLVDAYFSEVVLMPKAENRAVFPTFYFTLFYGSRK
ncbi:MAG: hypothetical protein HOP37_06205 [Cyclobacteriaceae bacterium]|nr:hypothetical protein [Cyclobacteriaceae bacterium]